MICECCGYERATHWMDWGDWLCDECCKQALEDSELEDSK